jgi:RIO kinase 1
LGEAFVAGIVRRHEPERIVLMPCGDCSLEDGLSKEHFAGMSTDVVRALNRQLVEALMHVHSRGIVHGDLSEFNILLGHEDGTAVPVIIDLPQAVDAAGNNHAQRMLLRDVANLRDFFGQFAPELLQTHYGPEIWDLYQRGLLSADVSLSGQFKAKGGAVDVRSLMREIDDARAEDAARRLRMQTIN